MVGFPILKAIDDPSSALPATEQAALKQLSEAAGIPGFRRKVAELSARLGQRNLPDAELARAIKLLHKEASDILREVVRLKGGDPSGIEFVNKFIH